MANLTDTQLKMLAEIIANAGQVCLASIVVPFLFGSATMNIQLLLIGLTLTAICWLSSLILIKD